MNTRQQDKLLWYVMALEDAITYSGLPLEVTKPRPKFLWDVNAEPRAKEETVINLILSKD